MPDRTARNDAAPLATNRPWLAVAGCLGGGVVAGVVVAVLLIAAVVLFVFYPELVLRNGSNSTFIAAIGELHKAPALRIGTREIAVHVDASVPTEATLRAWIVPIGPGWTIEAGRTKVDVFVPGNIVQYIVPLALDGATNQGLRHTESDDGKTWTVIVPPPRVDETVVEVQSDPRKIRIEVDRDWVDHIVGDDSARDAALAGIRAAVVRQGSSAVALFEVREKGRAVVEEMIRALLPDSWRDRTIVVRWADEVEAD